MSELTVITPASESIAVLIRAAETYLAGKVESTRRLYAGRIKMFVIWMQEQKPQGFLSLLKNYVSHLRDIRKLAARTIQGHMGVVKGVIKTAAMLDPDNLQLVRALPLLDHVETPRVLGQVHGTRLSPEQMQLLLETPGTDTAKGLRDTCIIGLLGVLGLRRGEVCMLNWGHIQMIDGHRVIANLKSKHGRIRTIKLSGWLYELIKAWGEVSGRDMTDPTVKVFCPVNHATKAHPLGIVLSQRDGIRTHTVYRMIEQRCTEAGLPVIKPHDLRRTAARISRDSGASIEMVQVMLGHSSPQTTSHYIGEGLNLNDHAVDYSPIRLVRHS
jgi:integrase